MSETKPCVTVLALGSAASALGFGEQRRAITEGCTLAELIGELERDAPRLAEVRARVRFAVNQNYAGLGTVLKAGDEVAIIPPVSGG